MMRKRLRIGCLGFLLFMLGLVGIVAACGAFLRMQTGQG